MRLEALTFDFWGTLYENAYARSERLQLLRESLERYGRPRSKGELHAAYSHAISVWERVWREERRSISIERWVDELLGQLDAKLPAGAGQELGRAMEVVYLRSDAPQPVPGVMEVVTRLAKRFRLGLVSDTGLTPGWVLRQVMERDGLLRHFDAVTFSDELGVTKPRPEPFLRTLRVLGTTSGKAAHIGDLPETDLKGARGVGMTAILFLGASHRDDGRGLADGVFEDYGELEGLLESVG
jgi:FMN phosphatase YigB (HAD superfamily)